MNGECVCDGKRGLGLYGIDVCVCGAVRVQWLDFDASISAVGLYPASI